MITGASGQDGTLLSNLIYSINPDAQQFLVSRHRRTGDDRPNARWIQEDFSSPTSASTLFEALSPDVIFHLSGSSSVASSWENPGAAMTSNTVVTATLLEAARKMKSSPRIVLAGSSEIFPRGEYLASESSPLVPSSPYGVSKATNLELGRIYREIHGLDISTAIMFNHESTIRDVRYVSRSISLQVAAISLGFISRVSVQSKTASKDWGWAQDFVQALFLLSEKPGMGEVVIATGVRTSVQELAQFAAEAINQHGQLEVIEIDGPLRPNDKEHPLGDCRLAKESLNWTPTRLPPDFMPLMVESDIARLSSKGQSYAVQELRRAGIKS